MYWGRSIVVWLVWFQCGSAEQVALQCTSGQQLTAAAAGIAWVFLDKILGHKLSAMGACIIFTVVGLVAITPAASS
jgi:Amt family ammonium transporter